MKSSTSVHLNHEQDIRRLAQCQEVAKQPGKGVVGSVQRRLIPENLDKSRQAQHSKSNPNCRISLRFYPVRISQNTILPDSSRH